MFPNICISQIFDVNIQHRNDRDGTDSYNTMRVNKDCERDPNELPGMDLNSSPSGWGGSSAYINVDTFASIGPEWIQIGPCGTN